MFYGENKLETAGMTVFVCESKLSIFQVDNFSRERFMSLIYLNIKYSVRQVVVY